MQYKSTRGKVSGIGFIDAFLMGLANDGGLLVPEQIPTVSAETLNAWSKLSYQELTLAILDLYTNDEIPADDLKRMVNDSYATFRHPEVTPVTKLKDELYLLELFHGPTFAFKDIALQFMGQLYTYVARERNLPINILGATSGDTGASSIEGVRGKEGINICILHPHGKVSKVQELQMTTVTDSNVLNLSVHGNFDDCQRMIKDLFADLDFKAKHNLCAINSINIVRIIAQTVYYFYAYFRVQEASGASQVSFSVPSGNFGDIFAGYLAKRMGLPVDRLVIATNANNILERFVETGEYKPDNFRMTYSPSMDIQVASNFERYLYYVLGENAEAIESLMNGFRANGSLSVSADVLEKVRAEFGAYGVDNEACLETIKRYEASTGYLLDPHSACGVEAAEQRGQSGSVMISLATAHPAKFDEAVQLTGIKQEFPAQISSLFDKPQRQTIVDGETAAIVSELVKFYPAQA
ncbi:threonine synthase [Paenibacillus curdlanolyticus YK9]|uniref:Threonine synthase n=1 Tax=Paenibacillus curdlanolyticus YK9 TaxID=717606 RepID=E0I7N9_9BACL|nr:threonine synthase [Paenibacillus curdlanolyticus]EFM11194.1 threonine synthase [Paenibacillus curdlanolyticus YK9]